MHLPVPPIEEVSKYNSATTIFLETTCFSQETNMEYLFRMGPWFSHKGIVLLHNLRGLDKALE